MYNIFFLYTRLVRTKLIVYVDATFLEVQNLKSINE